MKRTVSMFSAGLSLLSALLSTSPLLAQDVQGKVEATATPGMNNSAAQSVASSVTSQQLVRAAKAAGVYEGKDAPVVDWHIDGAIAAQGGERIIFAAFPNSASRGEVSTFYLMSWDAAAKKLIALPINHLVGVGARMVSSPLSSKAIAYVDKGKTDAVFVIDKSSLEPIQLIPDYGAGNFGVEGVQFNARNRFNIVLSIPRRSAGGSRKIAKWSVAPVMLPTASQLKQVILANQKQLKEYGNSIKISDIGVQKNWARCSIEVPGLDTATVIFKHEGYWKFVSLGTSFVDPPAGMPANLLD